MPVNEKRFRPSGIVYSLMACWTLPKSALGFENGVDGCKFAHAVLASLPSNYIPTYDARGNLVVPDHVRSAMHMGSLAHGDALEFNEVGASTTAR